MVTGQKKAKQTQGECGCPTHDVRTNDGTFRAEQGSKNAFQCIAPHIIISVTGRGGKVTGRYVFFMKCIQNTLGLNQFVLIEFCKYSRTVALGLLQQCTDFLLIHDSL